MKGFDLIAAEAFQQTDEGGWVFFPLTRFFRAFEVPNDRRKRELQQQLGDFLEVSAWLSLAVLFVAGSLGRLMAGALAMEVAVLAATVNFAYRATRGLRPSDTRYDSARARAAFIEHRSVRRLAAVAVLATVMTFFAAYAIQLQPQLWATLVPGLTFLAVCTALWYRLVRAKLELGTPAAQTNR